MSAPVILRSNHGHLFGSSMLPVLEEIFRAELERHPSRREQIFKVVPTERDIWQSSEMHDMPLFNEMAEGTDYSFERPKQGASKTLVIAKYGLGFSISEEAVDDGKFDFIADAIKKMGQSAKESQEIQAMNIINNGFGSTKTADGQDLFDSDHSLPSGGTFRNELSTPSDLSVSSLEQMLIDFETQFVGDSGIIKMIRPRTLLVPSALYRTAKELIGSDLKVNDVSSDNGPTNAMNSLKEDGLQGVSSPHLTDSDAWFLMASPSETGLRIVSRKPIETKAGGSDVGFVNDSILYKSRYREIVGATHAYGVFGTEGAS